MVAISLSKFGIWPILANSSKRHRTWTGRGTAFDERLQDEMSITVVATGFESTPGVDEPIQAVVNAPVSYTHLDVYKRQPPDL